MSQIQEDPKSGGQAPQPGKPEQEKCEESRWFLPRPVPTYAEQLPEALRNAKTAFFNHTGARSRDFDRFCEAFENWGRFEIVSDGSKADTAGTLSREHKDQFVDEPNGQRMSRPVMMNCIRISNARDDAPPYSDDSFGSKLPVSSLKRPVKNKRSSRNDSRRPQERPGRLHAGLSHVPQRVATRLPSARFLCPLGLCMTEIFLLQNLRQRSYSSFRKRGRLCTRFDLRPIASG